MAWFREGMEEGEGAVTVSQISGTLKGKTGLWKVTGSILNVCVCGAVQWTDGDRGWDKTDR